MRNTTKVWLITAASLVFAGVILFAVIMATLDWNFAKLSTVKYETHTYEIGESFSNISLTTDTADIRFALSPDGKCRVECYEEENGIHSVNAENDTLVVRIDDNRNWYDYVGFRFGSPQITFYLAETEFNALSVYESTGNIEIPKGYSFENVRLSSSTGDVDFSSDVSESLRINTSTGDIRIKNTSVGSLDLSLTTGKLTVSKARCRDDISIDISSGKAYLTDISCKSVISNGTIGNIFLNNVIAANKISVGRSTGNVKFDDCDAAEIYVKTNTGDVSGNLLTDKEFVTDTQTGSIDVPTTAIGGRCEIRTDTGDIKITVASAQAKP